jgi:uncharacterized protein
MTITRIAFSAVALLIGAAAAGAAPANEAVPRTLTVTGLGTARAAPDEANFSAGVVSQATTASQALAANARAMNAVIATLKKQGVPDKAIQTSNLSLSPQYQNCRPNLPCPQRIVGYEVSDNVAVTVGLDKAGAVLDALVASGSNQIGGISFSIHDPKPLLNEARADAVKDAIERGQLYARAAGVTLGPILSIQEGGGEAPRPIYRTMMKAEFAAAPTPIAAGEESLSASVTITWTIQ